MKIMDNFGEAKSEEEGLEALLDAAAVCLMKQVPEYWDKHKNKDEETGLARGGYSEEAEDAFDMPTVYRVIKICGGVDLNNPDLIRAAMEAAEAAETTGKN